LKINIRYASTLPKRNRYTVPETEVGKCSWTLGPFGIVSVPDIIPGENVDKHSACRVAVVAIISSNPPWLSLTGARRRFWPRIQPLNALIYMINNKLGVFVHGDVNSRLSV
jgi:hypothetical protein